MSVSASGVIKIESPRAVGLPNNLQVWRSLVEVTGDATAGIITAVHQTRFGDTDTYVAITRAEVHVNTGGAQDVNIELENSDWEWGLAEDATHALSVGTLIDGNAEIAGKLVESGSPMYCGRAVGTGNINVVFETNTNAAVYRTWLRGFISNKPFVVPRWMTA